MNDVEKTPASSFDDIAQAVAQTIQKEANVRAVFGEPQIIDGKTMIPVARVSVNGGGGGGGATAGDKDQKHKFIPMGGGMGLKIDVIPLGFICEKNGELVFNPLERDSEGVLDRVEHLVQSALQRRASSPPG